MAKQPRKHHYVPQFYLAGFTREDSNDGTLHVLDLAKKMQRRSTPKNTAHQRDFYAVHLAGGHDPMCVEKCLSQPEGKQSVVLRRICQDKALPRNHEEAFAELLGFVAFTATRVPPMRAMFLEAMDRISKAELRATFATEAGREVFRRRAEAQIATLGPKDRAFARRLLDDDPGLEQFAALVNSERYEVSVDQTWLVQQALRNAIELRSVLSRRKWSLGVVQDDAPDLVCSDSPVCLTWSTLGNGPHSPGFGLLNTFLTLPLNRRLALASAFEELPAAHALSTADVAEINARTMECARQVFSSEPDFVWKTEDGSMGRFPDLPPGPSTQ
ncbi:MAG: DUF4238 domain-containing protein [Pirellulales bacterium]